MTIFDKLKERCFEVSFRPRSFLEKPVVSDVHQKLLECSRKKAYLALVQNLYGLLYTEESNSPSKLSLVCMLLVHASQLRRGSRISSSKLNEWLDF